MTKGVKIQNLSRIWGYGFQKSFDKFLKKQMFIFFISFLKGEFIIEKLHLDVHFILLISLMLKSINKNE
jgi:hypothetical protein